MAEAKSAPGWVFIFHANNMVKGNYSLIPEIISGQRCFYPEDNVMRFIQCGNASKKRRSKGNLVAVNFGCKWLLGVVADIDSINNLVYFYICKDFAYTNLSKGSKWIDVAPYFSELHCKPVKVVRLIPLNQITGKRPFGMPISPHVINSVDGRPQCSIHGPDQLIPSLILPRPESIPNIQRSHGRNHPKGLMIFFHWLTILNKQEL